MHPTLPLLAATDFPPLRRRRQRRPPARRRRLRAQHRRAAAAERARLRRPGARPRARPRLQPAGRGLLPPPQAALEADYRRELLARHGIRFDRLLVLVNMPILRFGSTLLSRGRFGAYMALLRGAHRAANLDAVMCRNLVSVDWQGDLYDCDFNQMLRLPARLNGASRPHLRDLLHHDAVGTAIRVADHCYGCTAGQGSSCGGALGAAVAADAAVAAGG